MGNQYYNDSYSSYSRSRSSRGKTGLRLVIILILLVAVAGLGFFSFTQHMAIQSLEAERIEFEERLNRLELDNETLKRHNEELTEENRILTEENQMMRSQTIIYNGNRETNLVAITIDDGAGAALINQTLDYLKEHNVTATLFPMGWWVDQDPEVWQRAVEEGHELGNHTYSHAFLTTLSEPQIEAELQNWQDSVDRALGYNYRTLFFRPPGMYGFTNINSNQTKRYQEIIADHGMFTILWDIELVYALRNEAYTTGRIVDHVLANARGGSIVLLHFTPSDIAALPAILTGLRQRGLEPCSLGELLLAKPAS